MDHQVKIRGFRVELGEVESALRQSPVIAECVVVLAEARGDKGLVAYVVLKAGESLEVSKLSEQLRAKLPDYMVPVAFVVLERLPLTPNGKVDRKGLPAPKAETGSAKANYVAARTPTEEVLAGIWAGLLGVEAGGGVGEFLRFRWPFAAGDPRHGPDPESFWGGVAVAVAV